MKLIIDNDNLDRRVDNYIFSNFNNIPKSLIYKYIRIGALKINNKKTNLIYRLKLNDIIELPDFYYKVKNKKIYLEKKEIDYIIKRIIYEDDYLLIINKPHGISVHGGNNNYKNIISILKYINNNNKKLNLVHRLDKETSGILLISKSIKTLRNLHNQFNKNIIKREYIALVNGKWNSKNTIINIPILKIKDNKNNKSILSNDGKKSCSIFKINKRFSKFTLMNIKLITGRFHQIRLHAKYCGNSIVCDTIYGLKKDNLKINKNELNRLFLHANHIEFIHPIYNKKISIYSNIDKELSNFINKLI